MFRHRRPCLQVNMKNKQFRLVLSSFLLSTFLLLPLISKAQVRPIYDRGSAGLGQQLKRLQTTASAMHTGAHPDDEDSGLLAYLARHDMARTSYLSLNRGEGGQNVIGSELFENLGVIRTEELLQARRLDGGQQFFTRVMDYGFSKTRAEAEKMWDAKQVLGDMVLAIRKFRPLVIIARFSGTPADGHGHHQLSGYLTPIAFKAAADANQFPEQLKDGITVWQAKKLYVGQGFAPNSPKPSLVLNTGEYDNLIGRSYLEIAAEGRSQHKTQEMGSLELRGKASSGIRLLETLGDKIEKESSVFDGIDTSIKGIAKLTNNGEASIGQKLDELQNVAEKALTSYEIYAPQELIPNLASGVKLAREAKNSTNNAATKVFLEQKEREFSLALQMASSVVVDALSDTETIVAGDSSNVSVRIFAPENTGVKVKDVKINAPKGWKIETSSEPKADENMFRPRRENAYDLKVFKVMSPNDATPTQPYWLETPKNKFTFNWDNEAGKNLPFQTPLMNAEVKLEIGGEEITVVKPTEYRYADDIRGEIRRDVAVVPQVAVAVDSNLIIAQKSAKPSSNRMVVSVTNNAPRQTKGTLKLDLPTGWKSSPDSNDFDLKQRGEKTAFAFDVTIPANSAVNDYKITANAIVNGQTFDQTQTAIAYPHIQTHYRFTKAEVSAKVLDLKISPVKVGYIMGSGDKVPEAIKRLGLDVTMLEEKDLATGDLSKFDTIVVGIRASQVRPDYVANNGRTLDYVKNGGTLIVQYQQNEFITKNMLPFPAKMEGVVNGTQRISNLRVTDENAKVTILDPKNAVFNVPNKITDSDFDNWIQERNLYCLTDFAKEYTPLLSAADEGEEQINGGMLYAEIGKGKYLYSSYSWFRQLPVGNSGAYRIFANMLSLGSKKK
jgi:LmbE family N-acetylglucosaminyl deacetylase